jgi:TolA-binding protein
MGKVLRVLVVLLAILGIVATVFAYMNYNKREILIGRAHMLEDMFVKVAATLEAEDVPDTPQPSYPQRDISAVTSREIDNPERSSFWDSYNHKYEPQATPPPMMNLSGESSRLQLRTYYLKDPVTDKYVMDNLTGKPTTKGEGTMSAILDRIYARANAQYKTLTATRAELPRLREELTNVIDELNSLKRMARADKHTIEERDATIAQLESQKRDLENRIERLNEEIKEHEEKEEELQQQITEKDDEITTLSDRVKTLEQQIVELKGNTGITKGMITTRGALAEGVLTPGDKGKIVAANEEWKYAIVEFSDEFMVELIGPERNQALPQAEVMVRRASIKDPDQAFVTRLRLRQAIREKNLVIADILSDWQQKPVEVGDVVFN